MFAGIIQRERVKRARAREDFEACTYSWGFQDFLRREQQKEREKQTMACNPNNSCMGGHAKCLDIKIINACNAKCSFCIEKDGYCPKQEDVKSIALSTIKNVDYQDVLILGGEPLLYPYLEDYLQMIRPFKENIYMTTNGTLLDWKVAEMLSKYLDGINISMHHHTESKNADVFKLTPYSFDNIKEAIEVFNKEDVPVRINCNLVKGCIESQADAFEMINLANRLGANEIRFNELQDAEDVYVDARKIFAGLTDNPYCDGCVQEVGVFGSVKVKVKMTCGMVNKTKPPIVNPTPPRHTTKVVYPNAEVSDGWIKNPSELGCHTTVAPQGCHTTTYSSFSGGGCHGSRPGSSGCH